MTALQGQYRPKLTLAQVCFCVSLRAGPAQTYAFPSEAARWPDDSKFTHNDRLTWHTARWAIVAKDSPPEAKEAAATRQGRPAGQALEALQLNFAMLANSESIPTERALALCWVLHIVGDIHQPMHVSDLFSKDFPTGNAAASREWLSALADGPVFDDLGPKMFKPKGQTDLETLLAVSIIGPIGLPQEEAVYPQVPTADGAQMNAMNDYIIRMTKDELPPHGAFWSLTLYDLDNGFFIPNDHKKYSVGENGGMKLNQDGGIEIYIAAEKPDGVPEENWLPIHRQDENLSPQLRVYVPDLEKMKTWTPPKAERVGAN